MGRPDLQGKLADKFASMQMAARAAATNSYQNEDEADYAFYDGRAKAFADCERELEKAIEEAK